MDIDQLNSLIRLAKSGAQAALTDDRIKAHICRDRLHGWWECALSIGDHELACAAYRGGEWVDAANHWAISSPMQITESGRNLMWGEAS